LSANFHSRLVARSCKPIKYTLKALWKRTKVLPNRSQKADGWSCRPQQWHHRRLSCDCLSQRFL